MIRKLGSLFHKEQLDRDLDAELAFHRDLARERGNPIPLGDTRLIREQALDLWPGRRTLSNSAQRNKKL